MCGIVGRVGPSYDQFDESILGHRGPDSNGRFLDETNRVGLGHTRLAIQDLSKAGAQPMISASGRWVLTFNGEIYNHIDLRAELEEETGPLEWLSTSDTETLVEHIDFFGLDRTLLSLHGMFAFACLDLRSRVLYLARDRFGEKPLFYCRQGAEFAFASELKAVESMRDISLEIDVGALQNFLVSSVISAPRTAYKQVKKLCPGHYLKYDLGKNSVELNEFWDIDTDSGGCGLSPYFDAEDLIDELRSVVSRQLISDVPVGVFLSGGIDSTLVAAIASEMAGEELTAFTVAFDGAGYDESKTAAKVAARLGIQHKVLEISPDTVLSRAREVISAYDEPFGDYSSVPTYLLSEFASKEVTVVLTGDGGDELFHGYNRHVWLAKYGYIFRVPYIVRRLIAFFIRRMKFVLVKCIKKSNARSRDDLVKKAQDVADALESKSFDSAYFAVTESRVPEGLITNYKPLRYEAMPKPRFSDKTWSYYDIKRYLHDSVLTKVDRASMAHGLETRVPMLDHKLALRAWITPSALNIKASNGKVLLREAATNIIGDWFAKLPKRGFTMPLSQWLRGPLRQLAHEMVTDEVLIRSGLVNQAFLVDVLREHESNRVDHTQLIWNLLVLHFWLKART